MSDDLRELAKSGEEVRVDYASIERMLAELWRTSKKGDDEAVTRAALWNVVAHTSNTTDHSQASDVLGHAAASVPQRTIVVRANPKGESEINSWISANCHLLGDGRQVCSEEVAIVAGGDRVGRVPPLVNALLIPDMPVAVWWVGDLPSESADYIDALLEPADRIIVDSVHFDSPSDLALIERVAAKTATAPADLNWVRLEEWRCATAAVFDPLDMRARIDHLRGVQIVNRRRNATFFGESADSILYAAWISAQLRHHVSDDGKVEGATGTIDYRFDHELDERASGVVRVEFRFDDGSTAVIDRHEAEGVLSTKTVGGDVRLPDGVTRTVSRETDSLIVRQLKQTAADCLLLRALPVAVALAKRAAA